MCPVWFHAFSIKSDQGSQGRPKGNAVYVKFPIPPSLFITQVLKKSFKITFSTISLYFHNISFIYLFIYFWIFLFLSADENSNIVIGAI